MKKLAYLAFALVVGLLSCSSPDSLTGSMDKGSLSLTVASGFRTLAPDLNLVMGRFDITLTKGSTTLKSSLTGATSLQLELESGVWQIQVDGFNTDSPAKKIASGKTSAVITAGVATQASVSMVPLEGTGTLALTADYSGYGFTSPVLSGTLVPQAGGSDIPLNFQSGASSASSTTTGIPAGYYLLKLRLTDAGVFKGGAAEAVRIMADQVTGGTVTVVSSGSGGTEGSLSLALVLQMGLPAKITLSGLPNQVEKGQQITVTASAEAPQDSWSWLMDGVPVSGASAQTFTLPGDLALGTHRLDVVAKKGSLYSSAYKVFEVTTALQPKVWAEWGGMVQGSTSALISTETFQVTLYAENPATAEYKIGTGAWTAFTSPKVLDMGTLTAPGTTTTLTLRNQTVTVTYTFERPPVETGLTLYYYSASGAPFIWAWESGTGGRAIMTLDGYDWNTNHPKMTLEGDNWYKWSVPSKYLPLKAPLAFKINKADPEYTRTASGWWDGTKWNDADPRTLQVTLNPAGGSFSTDQTVNITLSGPGAATATVSATLGGSAVTVTGATVVVPVGTWAENTSKDLVVTAVSGTKQTSKTATFTRSSQFTPVGDAGSLRMYQVMVEAYQDSDGSGFSSGYGPSSHKGDIRGIINALPYIKSLGVNALWITPIFHSLSGQIEGQATGYFADNYFAVDPRFGTDQDFKDLVKACHDAGLYIILDGVFGHHGANIQASPSGKKPVALKDQWYGKQVDYSKQDTLDFYKEVAVYWVEKYGIDGWRLDQAYQVPVDKWKIIREAVEGAALARKNAGQTWGTLGYMVGEIWDGETAIASGGYGASNEGLKSNFDFPFRYKILQTLAAQEETGQSGAYNQPASNLAGGYASHSAYPSGAMPNLMLTNHDLVRFGDLIQRAPHLGYGPENGDYWKRHKLALGLMASYTGPITLYYGDEYGAEVPNFKNKGDSGFYDDHVSRDNGKISGFNANEQDLINFVKTLMSLRGQNESLWKGTRTNLLSTSTLYADKKDGNGKDFVVVLNTSTSAQTATLAGVGGSGLKDSLTGETFTGSGSYSVSMPALGFRILEIQ